MDNPTDKPTINEVFLDGAESKEKVVAVFVDQFVGNALDEEIVSVVEDVKLCSCV